MDPNAFTKFRVSGQEFELPSAYEPIKPIGHGAYGVVISACDVKKNRNVAIKKISRVFDDPIDGKRILREIRLMKRFDHENVVRLLDILPPSSYITEFSDVYIVQDLMETDLHRIIYSKQPLTIDHIQYFIYQILRGLKYIHSANVMHRDLKPSNLLVNSNADLRICDFGLARGVEDEQAGILTEYVVTRWYRAPEIMLACHKYSKAIDVWSVGCIFAELLSRCALFPGEDYIAQLRLICEKLGRPPEEELDFVTSEKAKKFVLGLPASECMDMSAYFTDYSNEHDALDLVKKLLCFHPDHRISIDDALQHPFLASLHNPEDEPHANFEFEFEFEDEELSRERLQRLVWDEIREFHSDIPSMPPPLSPKKRRPPPCLYDTVADGKAADSTSTDTDELRSRKRSANEANSI